MIPIFARDYRPARLLRRSEAQDGDWNVIDTWTATADVLAVFNGPSTVAQRTETGEVPTEQYTVRFNLPPSVPVDIEDRIRDAGATYRLIAVSRTGDCVTAQAVMVYERGPDKHRRSRLGCSQGRDSRGGRAAIALFRRCRGKMGGVERSDR